MSLFSANPFAQDVGKCWFGAQATVVLESGRRRLRGRESQAKGEKGAAPLASRGYFSGWATVARSSLGGCPLPT